LIMRYMDPNSDGELNFDEVADAFRKLHHKTEAEIIQEKVGGILMRIEDFMKEKGLRMLNVFQELDTDGGGSVTGEELMVGLLKLKEPSGKLKALIKRKNEADEQMRLEQIKKDEEERETKKKIAAAEASGVADVLNHLDVFMKAKGLTVATLCKTIDPEGKGELSAEDLVAGMEKMMQVSERSER